MWISRQGLRHALRQGQTHQRASRDLPQGVVVLDLPLPNEVLVPRVGSETHEDPNDAEVELFDVGNVLYEAKGTLDESFRRRVSKRKQGVLLLTVREQSQSQ